ncbi:zinc finger protein 276 isoform X3 [Protopterus annectens]|uniref:zinc finger protein 276 isoform X3 n=1 Tax=Protopterus annectens TaxID=7888 RepID=UPI001CFA5FE9|nr:zinc finger protein 276 isoform X3 [Protopterus annectens]
MKRDRRGRFQYGVQKYRQGLQNESRKRGNHRSESTRALVPVTGDSGIGDDITVELPGNVAQLEETIGRGKVLSDCENSVPSGIGKTLTAGFCRLCHGKFSSRSLRNAFGKVPVVGGNAEKQHRVEHVFFMDFQHLVGLPIRQDPDLPQFVCKNCHAQFYKCRNILRTFIQRVNTSPIGRDKSQKGGAALPPVAECPPAVDLVTSTPQCLHKLVTWTHNHASTCQSTPDLKSMLSSEYCGIIRAVWGCIGGHTYTMDTDCLPFHGRNASLVKPELKLSTAQYTSGNGSVEDNGGRVANDIRTLPCSQMGTSKAASVVLDTGSKHSSHLQLDLPEPFPERCSSQSSDHHSSIQDKASNKQLPPSTAPAPPPEVQLKEELSEASDSRDFSSDEDEDSERKTNRSSDESFEPYPEKNKVPNRKYENKEERLQEEPRVRKKPGPKKGWKKKVKLEREELPNIYKCPHQGCTAVYRGPDGMKKHIKEHHEEVRERPCPHPGCNKVFMIDRYLQRHVKLIHTEIRNYICDECGQTFKQRKHLSVHQMRHSGAKPLQCEVCGFQCRQRASLKYHMTKHKAETELEFACDQCGKRFEKAHNLNVHMSMVHPLTQNADKAKLPETEHINLVEDLPGAVLEQLMLPKPAPHQDPS